LPLGFGCPSGISAGPALLFTPFFLGPSVGGGIDNVGTGVPLATGVFDADSGGLSPFELAAIGRVFEVVDEESFEGDSSLMTGLSANLWRCLGDTFNLTIKADLELFRLAAEAGCGLVTEAVVDAIVIVIGDVKKNRGFGRRGIRQATTP